MFGELVLELESCIIICVIHCFVDNESPENGLVLLDARNLYETRIGKFDVPNVETLDPKVRQYSDLSSWIDDNGDRLKGKNIFM